MRIILTAASAALILSSIPAQAGPITRACMASDSKNSNSAVCGCIQQAANLTLDQSDQKLAAQIFRKPQMAQDIRMSSNARHEQFWLRYKAFGAVASETCS
ncbi:hypothetical protein [Pseudooceanicola nitratireducens]|uniref:hypothetical protein n=1 Tax=Pseudooceanicola nitratireducens TaxID=517719 RepID=UPI003C7A1ABF